MATKVQAKSAGPYESDFYVWALAQADLLRARRFDALDLDNLIQEVEGLADTKRRMSCSAAPTFRRWSISS